MKNIKEYIFNTLIVLVVIGLYIIVGIYIYNDFRERKRQEMSLEIINKADEEINDVVNQADNDNNHIYVNEVKVNYNNFTYVVLGKIKIDKIGIYEPILKENTKSSYDTSAVKISGPDINEAGNVTIGGHNYMKGNFFIKINKLVKNDVIILTDLKGNSVNYYVYEYGITTTDDSSYLSQPENNERIVTLVTCTKGGKERYYVKAKAK